MSSVRILKQFFGYENFREGQEILIDGILGGYDVLGIMPTGAGKSICFQVPALLMEGITIIVSPLISLMKDQVNSLGQAGVAAAYINSSLTDRQIEIVIERAKNGVYKLIYIAPERLSSPKFLSFAMGANISMVTVDEAHCISQWGQDFRPSYSRIPEFIDLLPKRSIVSAFTATATLKVREDILFLLNLCNPKVLVTGFDRANLYFEVQRPSDKFRALREIVDARKDKCGIVYCSTRKAVEEVCGNLRKAGYSASFYHGGLSDKDRHEAQDDFLFDRVKIMVATNAFGMGIDKSNVSFVVHYNMPKDMESYYQEAGRAGRDGEMADCFLLYSGQDVWTNSWMIDNAKDMEYADLETEILLKEAARKRLREMTFYCSSCECLRAYILKYFGEQPSNYCGNCVNCNTNFEVEDVTVESQKVVSCVFRAGQRFGINIIVDILRGSKGQRIFDLGLNELSTYGISECSDKKLKDIVNHLILEGFLVKSNDKFPVLSLGYRAQDLLKGNDIVMMKLVKEEERFRATSKSQAKRYVSFKPFNEGLFDRLKALRFDIAKAQGVPAFVVFTDSSLTDMAMKGPTTEEGFLAISGVGEAKLRRYGAKFLSVINDYVLGNGLEVQDSVANVAYSRGDRGFDKNEVEISKGFVPISTIADRINAVIIKVGYKKISAIRLNDWLVREGYLEKVVVDGVNYKSPSAKGLDLGIKTEGRAYKGKTYTVNFYGEAIQRLIVDGFDNIIEGV